MKVKYKKILIFAIIAVLLISLTVVIILSILKDETKLSSEERSWINQNINNVQNIYVTKEKNVFSSDGVGVFYDFINDFADNYGLKTNPITFESTEDVSTNIKLDLVKTMGENDTLFYIDHYIVVSKNLEVINDINELNNKNIGVLLNDKDYVSKYLKTVNITYNPYETEEELLKNIDSNDYLIVPRLEMLDEVLKNNFNIVYHLSDIHNYYVLDSNEEVLGSILTKYATKWVDENFNKSLKANKFQVITKSLGLNETDIDKLLSVDYEYGFVNNSPYEVIMSGNYGGIVAKYLQEFSELTGAKFNITKYKNYQKLTNAINKGNVDIYFDYNTNIDSDFKETTYGINTSLSIITNKSNEKQFNSIYGLQGEEVYVKENSKLQSYLEAIGNINIKTFSDLDSLFKYNDEDKIIVVDTYIFDYYQNDKLDNYVSKYDSKINNSYYFKINNEHELLYKLLNTYMEVMDSKVAISDGINLHETVVENGSLLNKIAKYTIIVILIILSIGYIVFKKSKRIRISRKVKKDEKIRFIDQLTSLKNRNYLADFIKAFDNNTIYPQTIIAVDLNQLQEINDKFGYDEGDKQIQACANALIKTQLDNSEIMRSDGNEFIIYLVGYTQKQVTSYIHKLNKELKKLPYPYGAEFGYSIIESSLKTIEDALNEAIEDMKKQKASVKNGKN